MSPPLQVIFQPCLWFSFTSSFHSLFHSRRLGVEEHLAT